MNLQLRLSAVSTVLMLAWLGFGAPPTAAEVKSSSPVGFTLARSVSVPASPAEAYQRFVRIGEWWNPAHSYSGRAENLILTPQPGGCFCERLQDEGFVEHLRVIYVSPGKKLALQGGLGPLQEMGATGTMTLSFEPAGAQTTVVIRYTVSGYLGASPRGLEDLAAPVDAVLGEQLQRYVQTFGKPKAG